MKTTFTKVGAQHTDNRHEEIETAFAKLEWQEFVPGLELPMMAGMAINAAIRQTPGGRPTHFAISNELAPFGLYGIRRDFSDGPAEIFLLDLGDECVVIASRQVEAPVTA